MTIGKYTQQIKSRKSQVAMLLKIFESSFLVTSEALQK